MQSHYPNLTLSQFVVPLTDIIWPKFSFSFKFTQLFHLLKFFLISIIHFCKYFIMFIKFLLSSLNKLLSILFFKIFNMSYNLSIPCFFWRQSQKPFVILFQFKQLLLGLLSISSWLFKLYHHSGTKFCHFAILDIQFNKTHCIPLSCFMPLFYCSNCLLSSNKGVLNRSIFFFHFVFLVLVCLKSLIQPHI